MEEQPSWKGHGFTLLVFGGIVFLCSIFFVLGMLVGRGQGQRAAETASAAVAAKVAASDARNQADAEKTELTTYREPETPKAPAAKPEAEGEAEKPKPPVAVAPAKPPSKPSTPAPTPAAVAAAATKMIYLQVDALEKSAAAGKEVDVLRKQGFPAIISSGDSPNKLYRVQVGPFSTVADADTARRKLEALGYKPIRK